jgi:hypothetical protein
MLKVATTQQDTPCNSVKGSFLARTIRFLAAGLLGISAGLVAGLILMVVGFYFRSWPRIGADGTLLDYVLYGGYRGTSLFDAPLRSLVTFVFILFSLGAWIGFLAALRCRAMRTSTVSR